MGENDIKLLVMDVDGTLTDGKIYIGPSGEAMKAFNVKDGLGIASLSRSGVKTAIITGRKSEIVEFRAKELGIDYVRQGISDKLAELERLIGLEGISYDEVAYIGDDINDYACMEAVHCGGGLTACPADAAERVREVASFICNCSGGNGAVREFVNRMMQV